MADMLLIAPCGTNQAPRCHRVQTVPEPAVRSAAAQVDTHRTQSCARTLTGQVACFGGVNDADCASRPRLVPLAP